jgi:N-acetylglutamate synthase-like GNAT family acetyltransferase
MIRRARTAEAAAITHVALRSKAHWGYDEAFMRACTHELTMTAEKLAVQPTYVREDEGIIVGYYALGPLHDGRMELTDLFVDPVHIGRGLGRELLDHAKRVARALGARTLEITSDPNAASFYVRAGANRIGERPSSCIPDRTLPLFELQLS